MRFICLYIYIYNTAWITLQKYAVIYDTLLSVDNNYLYIVAKYRQRT